MIAEPIVDPLTDVRQSRHVRGSVNFYCLNQKFVDEAYDVPPEAREIFYYSLAIGHHLGVVDCLKSVLSCSGQQYLEWISGLVPGSDAQRKMKGFLVFGEVTIYPEHLHMLAHAFASIDPRAQSEKSLVLTEGMLQALEAIHREPAMYMMIRGV
jgi:formate hydrogenlyase maturation protein HycH